MSEFHLRQVRYWGFLRQNLAFASRHTKEVAYKTLVHPKVEYAAPIWHPYHETQIGQVRKVQRTAAMWTCRRWRNTSSVGNMLDKLEWPSLETHTTSSLTFYKVPIAQNGRASALGAGGRGFESRPRHTKGVKNGTSSYHAWRSVL